MTERVQKWDILKAFLIFTVVLGHLADRYTQNSENMRSLYLFIYTFHMPLFIFVSGLFNKRVVNEKRKDKLAGYIAMYLFIKLIHFIYYAVTGQAYYFNLFADSGLPWFMFALFGFALITMFVKDFSPVYVMTAWILFACVAGFDPEQSDFLTISRIIAYYPFYYLGYCMDRKKLEDFCRGTGKKIVAAVFMIALALVIYLMGDDIYWIRPLFTGRNPFNQLGDYFEYGFVLRLASYVVSGLAGLSIIILIPNRTPISYIATIGQRTLAIFSLHYVVMFPLYNQLKLDKLFEKLTPGHTGLWIVPMAILIVLFLSLPIFDRLTRLVIDVPMKKK